MKNTLSIIIPVYNEKDSLEELYGEMPQGPFQKEKSYLLMMVVRMDQQKF